MKYSIVQDPEPKVVAQKVCEMMDEGWLPVGGVSVALSTYEHEDMGEKSVVGSRIFAQALVLPDKQGNTEKRILTGRFNG